MKAKLQAAKLACAACPVRTNLQLCLEEEEDGEAEAEVKHDAEDDDEAEAEVPESAALDANAFLDVLTRFDPTTVLAKASWPQLAMCERVCVVLRRWARREADARISRVRYAFHGYRYRATLAPSCSHARTCARVIGGCFRF